MDIEIYGQTPGCPGCIMSGRGVRRDHSGECRKRMEGYMIKKGDSRIDRYAKRVAQEAEAMVRKKMSQETKVEPQKRET